MAGKRWKWRSTLWTAVNQQKWANQRWKPCSLSSSTPRVWSTKIRTSGGKQWTVTYYAEALDRLRKRVVRCRNEIAAVWQLYHDNEPRRSARPAVPGQAQLSDVASLQSWSVFGRLLFVPGDRPERSPFRKRSEAIQTAVTKSRSERGGLRRRLPQDACPCTEKSLAKACEWPNGNTLKNFKRL